MTAPPPRARSRHPHRAGFNLRLWLPLSLIIACAVMALIPGHQTNMAYARTCKDLPDHTAHARNCWKPSGHWRPFCAATMAAAMVGIVSQLGLNPAIAQAALVGPDGKVITATRCLEGPHRSGFIPSCRRRRAAGSPGAAVLTLDRAQPTDGSGPGHHGPAVWRSARRAPGHAVD